VKEGLAIKRKLIGSNEFYIVGPKNDPAGIAAAKSEAQAYQKFAEYKVKFFSRGDNSGTRKIY
jgi:tungstate transport system substrate-binding protein